MNQAAPVKNQFGHRARLSLSPAGVRAVDEQAHAARTLWNLLHVWWRMMPREKRTLAKADAAIRQARKDIDFLTDLPAQAAQAVLKTYFRACRITGARLVKDALGWHIAFRVQTLENKPEPHQGPDVGIDMGIAVPLALSNGETFEHGEWLTEKEKARLLYWEQRAAQRKKHRGPGERASRRLQHTYDRIAGLRAKAKRRALDWQHRTTTAIARSYGTVVVEALTVTNMVKSGRGTIEAPGKNVAQKSGLNRAISGEAWGRTVTLLTYKTAQRGGILVKVPAPGTSQRCSVCGLTTPGSRESQAMFVCKNSACGWTGNADHNAARNVLHLYRAGLALVPAAGRAVVRRAKRVKPATAR
ncbi:RNA-guided endonuclease InsQ/TnpB family protein [Streptomyces sp. PB17]|uniref:RNA-guided endonuclease InsQ/TnpB family protein n=1 Tax=Streptomyces sp. PB17 TaxID=3384158 RepID=UPI0038B53A2B